MSRRQKIFDLRVNIRSHISPDACDAHPLIQMSTLTGATKMHNYCTDPLSLVISVNNAYFRVFRWFAKPDAKRTIIAEEVTKEIVHLKRK